MALPTVFDGISVAEAINDVVRDLNIQTGALQINNRKVFSIWGANFRGYVVAGAVFWHEDEGYYFDESYFEQSLRIAGRRGLGSPELR